MLSLYLSFFGWQKHWRFFWSLSFCGTLRLFFMTLSSIYSLFLCFIWKSFLNCAWCLCFPLSLSAVCTYFDVCCRLLLYVFQTLLRNYFTSLSASLPPWCPASRSLPLIRSLSLENPSSLASRITEYYAMRSNVQCSELDVNNMKLNLVWPHTLMHLIHVLEKDSSFPWGGGGRYGAMVCHEASLRFIDIGKI